jgi:hypothetical protein
MSDVFKYDKSKSASPSAAQAAGAGAGGGAVVGALATVFDENPNLKQLVKNVLLGTAGGAAIGGGVGVWAQAGSPPRVEERRQPSNDASPSPMSLPIAAVSGILPGIGPAAHAIANDPSLAGVGQAAGSGLASLTAATATGLPAWMKANSIAKTSGPFPNAEAAYRAGAIVPLKKQLAAGGASMLAALGAAVLGNKLQEKSAKLVNIWNEIEPVTSQVKKSEPVRTGPKFMARTVGGKKLGMMTLSEFLHLPIEKSAAKMVRKTVMREEHHDHCPHCDYEFREKSWPVKQGLPEDEKERQKAIDAGEYDEHCPSCGGIIDQNELSDAEIEEWCNQPWLGADEDLKEGIRRRYRKQRDVQRRRREEREKRASFMQKEAAAPNKLLKFLGRVTGYGREGQALALREKLLQRVATDAPVKPKDIPDELFHGTGDFNLKSILRDGLKPAKSTRSGSGSPLGQAHGDSVLLSRDPSYAKVYGKSDREGYYDWDSVPTLLRVVLPQAKAKKLKDVMGMKGQPFGSHRGAHDMHQIQRDTVGVGRFSVDEEIVGIGSELAHPGVIDPKFIAKSRKGSKKLQAQLVNEAISGRQNTDLARLGRVDAIIADIQRRKKITDTVGASVAGVGVGAGGSALLEPLLPKGDRKKSASRRINAQINGFSDVTIVNVLSGSALRRKKDQREKQAGKRLCPGCKRPFEKDEPYPNVEMCEVCERYGPPKKENPEESGKSSGRQEKAASVYGGVSGSIRKARNDTHTDPTPAQAHAGNYKKGEFSFSGLTIKVENPKGTERVGYNKKGEVKWRRMMHADYGYFKGTEAIDGDAVDVFVGPDLESDFVVAIDQYKDAGNKDFDETKFIIGVTTQEQGEKLYLRHYPRGWRLGPVSTTTVPQLKAWLKSGKTKKPFKGQRVKAAGRIAVLGG